LKSLFFKSETLRDLVCIDFFYKKKRFSLFYNYLNYNYNISFFFFGNVSLYRDMPYTKGISSLWVLYKSALWLEREVWDLFGVFFLNHCDLRRLLTDYGFIGFPLRKEFPLIGYKDNRYDDFNHVILYENIQHINQNYRLYEYTNTFVNFK
jgi:NADH-quinone oxidoreductase subunit C